VEGVEVKQTLLEKVEKLTSLVEKMYIAQQMGDDKRFKAAHKEASKIGFEVVHELQESEAAAANANHK
jgi:hypothetical protein